MSYISSSGIYLSMVQHIAGGGMNKKISKELETEKDHTYYGSDTEFLEYLYKQVDDTQPKGKHILRERILLCTKLVMALGEKENRILGAYRIMTKFPANFDTDGNVISEDMKQGQQKTGPKPDKDNKEKEAKIKQDKNKWIVDSILEHKKKYGMQYKKSCKKFGISISKFKKLKAQFYPNKNGK